MVMLVLVSAVTLSPMVKVMGLWSLASIACGFGRRFNDGFDWTCQSQLNTNFALVFHSSSPEKMSVA